jgi:hypothetical protein
MAKNWTNQKYHSLTFVAPTAERRNTHILWETLCDCGGTRLVLPNEVIRGAMKNCGCDVYKTPPKDWSGQKFNRLTFIRPVDQKNGTNILWEVLCDCGATRIVIPHLVASGKIKNCGCDRKTNAKDRSGRRTNAKDWTGQKYNHLTFIRATDQKKSSNILWEVVCDCGNTRIVVPHLVERGITVSCGCIKNTNAKDWSGKKFYSLTIIKPTKDKRGTNILWEALCECGNIRIVSPNDVKRGLIKSCGCQNLGEIHPLKSREKFIEECIAIYGNLYDYSSVIYENSSTEVIIICPEHGQFEKTPTEHLHYLSGCPLCNNATSISVAEKLWLSSLGIPDDNQHRQVLILGKRVDGFDPITNTIYEFNGDFWHGNPAIYDEMSINKVRGLTFGTLHQKTLEREKMFREAGYNFISIWESDFRNELKRKKVG